jgi:hypothetical protein
MRRKTFYCVPLLGIMAFFNAQSFAATVTSTFLGVTPAKSIKYSLDGGLSYRGTAAGQMNWQRTGGTHDGGPVGDYDSFCIELTQHVSTGKSYEFDVVDLSRASSPVGTGMGEEKAMLMRELWGRHHDKVHDADTAAAFQISLWEILYDPGLLLGDGDFRVRLGASKPLYYSLSEQWLATLDGTGPKASLRGLAHGTAQDQVTAVPLPAAATAGFMLLAVLGIKRLRQNNA